MKQVVEAPERRVPVLRRRSAELLAEQRTGRFDVAPVAAHAPMHPDPVYLDLYPGARRCPRGGNGTSVLGARLGKPQVVDTDAEWLFGARQDDDAGGMGPLASSQARRFAVTCVPSTFTLPVPRCGFVLPSQTWCSSLRSTCRSNRAASSSEPMPRSVSGGVSRGVSRQQPEAHKHDTPERPSTWPLNWDFMVRPLGLEPRTCGLRVRCSAS